jgi:excisionase family DNA binding protein
MRTPTKPTVPQLQPHLEQDALLTVGEVADILRLTPEAVYAITRRGKLPCLAFDTGRKRPVRRWRRSDVRAYIERSLRPWPSDGRR